MKLKFSPVDGSLKPGFLALVGILCSRFLTCRNAEIRPMSEMAIFQQLSHSYYRTLKHSSESQEILGQLFQVLVHRLGHLKHVQFLAAEDRLQLVVGQDFPFVLWVLKIVLLDVRPNLFCDFTSRQRFCADNLGQVL
jgi:hypothetical protein